MIYSVCVLEDNSCVYIIAASAHLSLFRYRIINFNFTETISSSCRVYSPADTIDSLTIFSLSKDKEWLLLVECFFHKCSTHNSIALCSVRSIKYTEYSSPE